MAVFISYAHSDRDFVDKFAIKLVENRTKVWLDRWELKVGESLIQRIQDAIQDSDALVVVLSEKSVESEWCKKELSAGLIRELEEKRVVVLPVVIDNCKIPLFLKDKKYADFRQNFNEAMFEVVTALARVTSDVLGRSTGKETESDWSIDSWTANDNNHHFMKITIAERTQSVPYTVLSEVIIIGNKVAANKMLIYEQNDLDWFGRQMWLNVAIELIENSRNNQIRLIDNHPYHIPGKFTDEKTGIEFDVDINIRRLGEDTGMDIVFDIGNQLKTILSTIRRTTGEPTRAQMQSLQKILTTQFK